MISVCPFIFMCPPVCNALTNTITIYSPTLATKTACPMEVFATINDNKGHPRRLTSDKRLNYFPLGKEAFRLTADMGSLHFRLPEKHIEVDGQCLDMVLCRNNLHAKLFQLSNVSLDIATSLAFSIIVGM